MLALKIRDRIFSSENTIEKITHVIHNCIQFSSSFRSIQIVIGIDFKQRPVEWVGSQLFDRFAGNRSTIDKNPAVFLAQPKVPGPAWRFRLRHVRLGG